MIQDRPLAIFGDCGFSASGRSEIWRERHFSASGLSDFGEMLKGLFGTVWPIRRARVGTESSSTE